MVYAFIRVSSLEYGCIDIAVHYSRCTQETTYGYSGTNLAIERSSSLICSRHSLSHLILWASSHENVLNAEFYQQAVSSHWRNSKSKLVLPH